MITQTDRINPNDEPQFRGDANYAIALETESGAWDLLETFEAASDAEANTYAETNYPDDEWYVVDRDGNNING